MSMEPQATLNVRIARKMVEATGICCLDLIAEDGHELPGFSAGSHVDVYLPGGLVRQYSLCNNPDDTRSYQIAVLREPASRGGSAAVHDLLKDGDVLRIGTPRNHFALAPHAQKSLLFAGGIGVTPILAMAEKLAALGADFRMHYAARSRDRMAFLGRIRRSSFAGRVSIHFDDEAPEQRLDLATALAAPEPETHLYVCGPKGFIETVLGTARTQGWRESQLHWGFFAGDAAALHVGDVAFEVQLNSSGRVIVVPADKPVAQALADAGVEIAVSCEQGVCGTCLTGVIAGEVDHRDLFLTPEEQAANDRFTPCCSRARSPRLVLDL